MTDPFWRWHLITRVIAGVLGLALIVGGVVALVTGAQSALAGSWRVASVSLVALPAFILARLFLIGAWTGEEPAISFADDGDHDLPANER